MAVTTNRAIIQVNSIVSEWNYDILTSIIAQLLPSRPFPNLCLSFHYSQVLLGTSTVLTPGGTLKKQYPVSNVEAYLKKSFMFPRIFKVGYV